MSKKMIVAIILLVLLATLGVILSAFKSKMASPQSTTTAPAKVTAPKAAQSGTAEDADLKAMDSELNSLNDEELGEGQLSDQNVGL